MVFEILADLEKREKLDGTVKFIIRNEEGKDTLMGSDIKGFSRSALFFVGGESFYEEFSIPLGDIMEIWEFDHLLFRRKESIDRIFEKK